MNKQRTLWWELDQLACKPFKSVLWSKVIILQNSYGFPVLYHVVVVNGIARSKLANGVGHPHRTHVETMSWIVPQATTRCLPYTNLKYTVHKCAQGD